MGEVVLVGPILCRPAHGVEQGLGPRRLHVLGYLQVSHAEGAAGLRGGLLGEPSPAKH